MSFPTAVNEHAQAEAEANAADPAKVLQDPPAAAMGNFMIATSQALSNAAHNATSGQQNAAITAQAALVQGIETLYAVDTAATGVAIKKIFE